VSRRRGSRYDLGTDSHRLRRAEILHHFIVTIDTKHMKMQLALPKEEASQKEGTLPADEEIAEE
jgi:hypothetical protein